MSLINDALKKAARQRAEEQADVVAPMPGGGTRRVARQGAPMRTQTMVLIAAAALVLIVVSVVVTGILMTGKPEIKPVAAAIPSTVTPPQQAPAPKIIIQAPTITVAVPQQSAPAPVALAIPSPTPTPVPVVQAPVATAQSSPVAAAASQSHTDMVQGVVDGYHISGVRLAGAGSKALVDGHVYKLNDIVDKSLGLKLVKVDDGQLTFVDRDGNTFIRTF
jgi:hypothetical protein